MPNFPISPDIQRIENFGALTASSIGTSVTGSVSAHVKGSYFQLIAATSFQAKGLFLSFTNGQAGHDFLVDIAIGGAGSEQIIIANLLVSQTALNTDVYYFFPVEIPAGSRISARLQSTTTSGSQRVSGLLLGGGMAQVEGWSGVETLGADTSDSGGTSIDPGGTINTKGSYVQVTAACGHEIRGLSIGIGHGQNGIRSNANFLVDIAIGGAGSEQVIVPNVALHSTAGSDMILPLSYNFIPIRIPSGSRIAVRAQCDINDAADRLFDVVLYGVY